MSGSNVVRRIATLTPAGSRSVVPQTFEEMATESQHTRRMRINPRSERLSSLFAAGGVFRGDVDLAEGFKLDGHIHGNVKFGKEGGLAIVSRMATLEGDLHGPKALIMGTVQGDIYISGLLMLAPTAMVMGNVYYERLIVHDGAQISGAMRMNNSRSIENRVVEEVPPVTRDVIQLVPSSRQGGSGKTE